MRNGSRIWMLSLVLVCGSGFPQHACAEVAVAVRGTPVIDGEVDDAWAGAMEIRINRPVIEETQMEAADAATGTARMMWDERRLYLLVEVKDAKVSAAAPQPWEHDSVELFLDELANRAGGYDANDSQIRVNCQGSLTGAGALDADRVEVAAKATASGYRVEVAVLPVALALKERAKLGFELQINDDPGLGARRAIMKWHHANNESWRDTSKYGTLVLLNKWDPTAPAAVDDIAADQPAAGEDDAKRSQPALTVAQRVPDWAADAIFYQIFPERFRNGDPSNDPTRESLEDANTVPESWTITRWTSDWYARSAWERKLGEDFYENGVFHRRYGGDLQGVIDQLGYLERLGINTIYLNPVFYARSLHKYDGNTFHHVDPYFGPDAAGDLALIKTETSDPQTWKWTTADRLFLDLIRAAHAKEMRVIIDGVFNHTGRDFFAFEDLRTMQEKSSYGDWYVVEHYDDPNTPENEFKYQCWWGVHTLPEFANSADDTDLHEGPKQYIFDATSRWMDPNGDGDPADGIDGWRLDVANEVPDQFWVDWNRHVRALNPEAYTVAEIWVDASKYLERCGFSATMNYHGFAFLTKGFLIDGAMSPSAFAEALKRRAAEHAPRVQYALQNLIDSHDTDRVASMIVNARPDNYKEPARFDYDMGERASARNDPDYQVGKPDEEAREIQRLVALFQMSFVGAPMIYYGTEAGMWGGDDPDDRKPMVWMDLIHDDETSDPRQRERSVDKVAFDEGLFEYYCALIALRKDHPALRRGAFTVVNTNDEQQTIAYRRQFEQDTLLVALNRSDAEQSIEISLKENGLPSRWAVALESGFDAARIVRDPEDDNVITVRLKARSGAILEAIAD